MRSIFIKSLFAICSFIAVFNELKGGIFEDQRKRQMIQDLELIKHHFEVSYAPLAWKKEYAERHLEHALEDAKRKILDTPGIHTKQFQQIVRQFLNSTMDYHVDALFYSTEAATLPFSVKGVEGRYFIDWIDPIRLSPSFYALRVGDELIQFGCRPIGEVIDQLLVECGSKSNPQTDRRIAEISLTERFGKVGDVVPKGPIMITTRSAFNGRMDTCQLHWSYTPEHVTNPLDLFSESIGLFSGLNAETDFEFPREIMAKPLHETFALDAPDHKGGLGAMKSFLPVPGELIWNYEDQLKEAGKAPSNWEAYVYRHPSGKAIGFIRIPHYHESHPEAIEFGEVINQLEEKSDLLVIDQLHNFGGYVDYMYELASILAIEPMSAPYHRIKITQKEAMGAYRHLEMMKLMDDIGISLDAKDEKMEPSAENKKSEKKEDDVNYQERLFLRSYYEKILEEWNKGHSLTSPTPILGIDRINPHPKYRYTKPILILIDEMDFSGADFMPAILQDNGRATLFGSKTAGAGGYVKSFSFPNTYGIAGCSYTASIAERPNNQKIENLGVTPDIEYRVTVEDLQSGYQGYARAINDAVQQLLEKHGLVDSLENSTR